MADYLGVLDELETRRQALVEEVGELDSLILGLKRLAGRSSSSTLKTDSTVVPGNLRGLTLSRAVLMHMKSVGQPQTTRNVVDALRAAGVPSEAKSFPNQVYNALHRGSEEEGTYIRQGNQWRLRGVNTSPPEGPLF